uniref:Uncharacterized protein n=1 Tax=Anguilla anguilla TaxID=7936 RepID=A0A0E9VHZ7_ANGAN
MEIMTSSQGNTIITVN